MKEEIVAMLAKREGPIKLKKLNKEDKQYQFRIYVKKKSNKVCSNILDNTS